MRVKVGVFLLLVGAVAVVRGAPAKTETESGPVMDSEIVIVPLEHHSHTLIADPSDFGDQPIVDTEEFSGPFSLNPFGNLFQSLESMMYRMRQQLSQVLSRLPARNESDHQIHVPSFGDIDLDKANSTSVVKIINGHKVVINETEYKQQDENGGAFFKVRIIDVKPEPGSTEATTEAANAAVDDVEPLPTTSTSRDVESAEDTLENEISKSKEVEAIKYENLETFDDIDSQPSEKQSRNVPALEAHDFENTNNIETVVDQKPIDLSRDIYVNQLLADAGAPMNPDAEVFDPIDAEVAHKYQPMVQFEKIVNPR